MKRKSYELLERIVELTTGPTAALKSAAGVVGVVKPDDSDWDSVAEQVAAAEFRRDGRRLTEEAPEAPPKRRPDPPPSAEARARSERFYKGIGLRLTGSAGVPVPIDNAKP